jgi:hypothetical protein
MIMEEGSLIIGIAVGAAVALSVVAIYLYIREKPHDEDKYTVDIARDEQGRIISVTELPLGG